MKFFAALLVLLPVIAQIHAISIPRLVGRQTTDDLNNARVKGKIRAQNNSGSDADSGGGSDNGNDEDPQTSLTLDPRVISKGFELNGLQNATAGEVASKTSSNNFINYCLTVPLPLTDGKQIPTGSCNNAPYGVIPGSGQMTNCQITTPENGGTVPANQDFTIEMNIRNLDTGNFVNADTNYYSAPQFLNNGIIAGHSHFVIQLVNKLSDPTTFAFFVGANNPAQNGVLSSVVTGGLPPGNYRLCSINTAANHQPVLLPIARRGSADDCVYFTAADGSNGGGSDGDNGSNDGGDDGSDDGSDEGNGGTSASSSAASSSETGSVRVTKHGRKEKHSDES